VSGAGDTAMESLKRHRVGAARKPDVFGDFGHGAHRGELLLVPRHQQYALFLAGIDGQRERHAREDDDVVQRDQEKSAGSHSICLRFQ